MKVLNKEKLFEQRKANSPIITPRVINKTSLEQYKRNINFFPQQEIEIKNMGWKNSQTRASFVKDIGLLVKNAETGYDPSKAASLFGAVYMDVMRLSAELPNYRDTFFNINSKPDIRGQELKLRSLFPDIVIPAMFSGTGDHPPAMQQVEGMTEDIPLELFGFERVDALRRLFQDGEYDNFAESCSRAIANSDNDLVFAPMVGATYDTAHTQAYVTKTGWSRSRSLYETIIAAEDKIISTYYNYLTGQKLSLESFEENLYTSIALGREIARIQNGNIVDDYGGVSQREALAIDNLIPYDGSPDNGKIYKGEPIAYAGVPANVAFLQLKTNHGAQFVSIEDWFFDEESGQMRIDGKRTAVWRRSGYYYDSVLPTVDSAGRPNGAIIKILFSE
ncbi:hypothetical protein FACS1894151_08090 [Spirochaetia bacterium]|nr:hypothetical protein FACS1894151_08090 [Spirochaetia bacterium]